ncbi:MAG: DUF669 domain-containing protein [Oscillospiraceae bacterium]
MENNNYVFDWNDEINNEDSFVLLPDGDYEFTVKDFERTRFDGSDKLPACNKAIVTLTVHGEHDNAVITENFLLCSQLEWKISALFLSVGMKKHGEPLRMNWGALPGKKGRCRVFTDNYKKKDGSDGQSNKIKKFYAYDEDVNIIQPVQKQPSAQQVQTSGWQAGKF